MEESLRKEPDWSMYSPLTLAYMGDAVFDLIIRTAIVRMGNTQATKLHYKATKIVCAKTQADMIHKIMPLLSEEEAAVFRRGHNADPHNTAKNVSRRDYLEATGFEALIGYLYLLRRYERMKELVAAGLERTGFKQLRIDFCEDALGGSDCRMPADGQSGDLPEHRPCTLGGSDCRMPADVQSGDRPDHRPCAALGRQSDGETDAQTDDEKDGKAEGKEN